MTELAQDLRYALRQCLKNPVGTGIMIFTLALGIGAVTAIFSVVYGVLLRPLPYPEANRIAAIFEVNSKGTWSRLADPNFDDFRDQNHSFQTIAKYTDYITSVAGGSQPTRTDAASVSPDFFKVFRVQPMLGRGFVAEDARKGAAPVVVLSYGYWKQYLGGSNDLSRWHLKIDDAVYSVVGVMPEGFQFPKDAGLWFPADLDGENPSRTAHNYSAVGRLREGISLEQANAEISGIARRIHEAVPDKNEYLLKDAAVVTLHESLIGKSRFALLILLGAVGFLLLVACANVANLMLAQASVRERELAIRSALGAGRRRLVQQFLTETLFLSLVGGTLGVLGAYFGVSGLVAMAPEDLPRLDSVSINVPVLLFALGLSVVVATVLGAFIALRATSGNVQQGLAEGGRGQTASHSSQRIGRGLAVAQIAVTLVLVIGAGLLGRSLMKVLEVDPGFRVDKIVTMDVFLPWAGYDKPQMRAEQGVFFSRLIERLKQIPGVHNIGATSGLPLDGGNPDGMFVLMQQEAAPQDLPGLIALFRNKEHTGTADFCSVSDGYFRTLGIPLVRGRIFEERDGADSPQVAVISDSLARQRWPGQDPIGQRIEFGNMDGDLRVLTVVGIVADVHVYGLDAPPRPTVYVNSVQRPRSGMTIAMLTDADVTTVTTSARTILHELNPEIAPRFRTFPQIYSASMGSRRFNLILVGMFAVVALMLATAGVFGVMAYSVSRRTKEIGVRVALGATSRHVIKMVLGQGMRTILLGIAIGIIGSLLLTRALQSLLFGVTATDPVTFGFVMLLLIVVGLLACYIPVRRAVAVDPMVALRYE